LVLLHLVRLDTTSVHLLLVNIMAFKD
jgi:hypothetical protein